MTCRLWHHVLIKDNKGWFSRGKTMKHLYFHHQPVGFWDVESMLRPADSKDLDATLNLLQASHHRFLASSNMAGRREIPELNGPFNGEIVGFPWQCLISIIKWSPLRCHRPYPETLIAAEGAQGSVSVLVQLDESLSQLLTADPKHQLVAEK